MAEQPSPWIIDVNEKNFVDVVANGSKQAVVIVDFWAEWCGPCKMLGPLLEQIVDSYGGQVILAKVNVDENQMLSQQFGVRSIPTVKIVKDGEIVDEFVGALPEADIRAKIEGLAGAGETDPLEVAAQLIAEGKKAEASEIYAGILEKDPKNSAARLAIARLLISENETENALTVLEAFEEGVEGYSEARALIDSLEYAKICHEAGGPDEIRRRVESDPADLEALYLLACCHASGGDYDNAFETLLRIIAKDKSFEEGKAQETMKSLFEIVGQQDDLTRRYRSKLANLLF